MSRLFLAFVAVLAFASCRRAEPQPQMQMHRLQATDKDASGWYLAKSTGGSFSILLPIPFNDFTITTDDPKVGKVKAFVVGGKSSEGVKFSAMEAPIVDPKAAANVETMADGFRQPGNTVSNVDTSPFAGFPSVAFSVEGPTSGAHMRYVKTPKSMFAIILEYPMEQKSAAEGFRGRFLSSLKIEGVVNSREKAQEAQK
jgi:hypothetical protein